MRCFARNDPNFEWSENYAVVVTHKAFLLLNEWLILNLNFWRRWARKSCKRVEKWKEKLRDYWWQKETTKWRLWRKKEMGYFECVERGIRLWCTFSASVRSWHNWCTRNVTAGLPPSFTGSCVNIMVSPRYPLIINCPYRLEISQVPMWHIYRYYHTSQIPDTAIDNVLQSTRRHYHIIDKSIN